MLTDEQIAELKSKHGSSLMMVTGPTGPIVVKKPSRLVYDKWFDAQVTKASASSAAREIAQACVVFPDWGLFMSAIDAEPSLLTGEVLGSILELAGNKTEYETKKL